MKEDGKNYRLTIKLDYGECLFWDESGSMCGTTRSVFVYDDEDEIEVDLSSVEGLSEWYDEWEYCMDIMYGFIKDGPQIKPEQKKLWDKRGLVLAKAVKRLLPDDVEILYICEYSNEEFLLTGASVEKIRG